MSALLWRDLRILYRNPQGWLMGILFFLMFLSLFAIALNGSPNKMKTMGPTIIWLAVIFSQLLNFGTFFQNDIQSGYFEQLKLSGVSSISIIVSKIVACFLTSIIPLLFAIPVAAISYQLGTTKIAAIMLSVLIGAPAIIAYGVLAGALIAGQKNGGFLVVLLTLPFMVPIVIFALSGIEAYPAAGVLNSQFQALSGISLIALAVSVPAASAALSAYLD